MFTNVFKLDVLTNRVNTATARLLTLARDTNEIAAFRACGETMNQRIIARHDFIANQLAASASSNSPASGLRK